VRPDDRQLDLYYSSVGIHKKASPETTDINPKVHHMEKKQPKKTDGGGSPEGSQQSNHNQRGIDQAPGEERGKGEKLSSKDLKGKKVDGDPSQKEDRSM